MQNLWFHTGQSIMLSTQYALPATPFFHLDPLRLLLADSGAQKAMLLDVEINLGENPFSHPPTLPGM